MLTASNVQLNADVIKGLQRLISIVEPIQINMVNGSSMDFTTYYDISKGSAEFIQETMLRSSFALQISVADLTGTLDAILDIYGSNDRVNWGLIAPTAISRITLNTTPDTSGWTKDLINYNFIKVVLTVNNCTGGKLNLLMVMK